VTASLARVTVFDTHACLLSNDTVIGCFDKENWMAKGKGSTFRSAISGKFVTAKHGRANSKTTVQEAKGGGSTGGSYRSAISGRFVTTKYGKSHPHTTIKDS